MRCRHRHYRKPRRWTSILGHATWVPSLRRRVLPFRTQSQQRFSFRLRPAHAMLRLRLQKLGSILGLLAILMTTLAPTVSQALAARHRLADALATYCTADATDTDSAPDGDGSHPVTLHMEACAYCGLLLHAPILPGTTPAMVTTTLVVRAPVLISRSEVRASLIYTAALPRAPPRFS